MSDSGSPICSPEWVDSRAIRSYPRKVLPAQIVAEQHRKLAEPGTADKA